VAPAAGGRPPPGGDAAPRRATLRALLAAAAAAGLPARASAAAARTLLVHGDSLSAEYGLPRGTGWVALLEQRLADRRPPVRVVNASISGETTSGGRTRLPDLLSRHAPAVVVIELGGNDALRGLPLASTEQNLREMVRAAKAAGARPLVLGMRMPPNYGRAYAEQFEALFRRVTEAERVPLVPFFLEAFGEKVDYFQPDRIHPAQKAQPLMLDAVWPALSKLI
jgi:acyl-CoA thioesterase-1